MKSLAPAANNDVVGWSDKVTAHCSSRSAFCDNMCAVGDALANRDSNLICFSRDFATAAAAAAAVGVANDDYKTALPFKRFGKVAGNLHA